LFLFGDDAMVRIAACFALLVLSGLLASTRSLIPTRLFITGQRGFGRRRLVLMLRVLGGGVPIARRTDLQTGEEALRSPSAPPPAPDAAPDPTLAALNLKPIELALIAELSLEMARAHDEVASDASRRLDVRRTARKDAAGLRERARLFQLEAQRLSAYPTVDDERSAVERDSPYTGPERRTQDRRVRPRRAGESVPIAAQGGLERRMTRDRRRADRRREDLALR
jgi:hypothetical protein